ncbi:LysR family transcriptional regulator [Burkholderia sp. WSM2232]|uniref:LysR family transcriptional regulator n=1 Tax=Burkholderia sp. WSM2232 TaxID=944436 RepID=UPI000407B86F|nr:LysR family transcriptional regulator [Burkholderia sp. WSM2232]
MKTHQLKAFLAVVEHRSIRGAARALQLTQPAITRVMRELEGEFGVPLIARSARGIELTQYGQLFESRARLLLQEMRRTREELDRLKSGKEVSLVLAISPTVALTVFPAALDRFSADLPAATVNLFESSPTPGLNDLRSGQLDLFVTHLLDDETYGRSDEFALATLFPLG